MSIPFRPPVAALCGLAFYAAASPARAEESSVELPAVVVTGTRTEKPLLESPVRTEVVDRKELERTHARDLKEALEDVPGLVLKPIHGKSGFEAWLQGLDSDRVLVIVNGEPITPSTGSTVDLSQIAVMDVERIEIVKGATSALYGSNAMGGVINVITRRPQAPLAYRVNLDGGGWGDKNLGGDDTDIARRHLSGRFAAKRSQWYLDSTFDLRDSDGYDLEPSTYNSEGASGLKANLDTKFAWTPDEDTEVYLAPRYYSEDISNDFSTFAPGVGDIQKKKREDAERWHTTFGAARKFTDGSRLRSWLVYDRWVDVTQQDAVATPQVELERDAKIDLYRAELQWDRPVGDRHLFTAGLLAGYETLAQDKTENGVRVEEVNDGDKRNLEAYLQDDIFLSERWELLPGLRVQDDSGFGFHAAPKINAMVTPDWFGGVTTGVITNVRFGYGKGYRVPNLKERYFAFDHSSLGYRVFGNPDLRPESSDSFQTGIELARSGVFRADLSLFYNRIEDLIGTDLDPAQSTATGLMIFTYQNIARAMTEGAELSGQYHVTPRLRFKGGYTFLASEDRDTGKTLTRRPEHQIKAGMDYERADWGSTFTLRAVYQSEEFIDSDNTIESPAWTTWDVKLTQALGRGFKVYAGIDNLTDQHRDPAKGGNDFRPEEGRFVYAGVSVDG